VQVLHRTVQVIQQKWRAALKRAAHVQGGHRQHLRRRHRQHLGTPLGLAQHLAHQALQPRVPQGVGGSLLQADSFWEQVLQLTSL